jgi:hypothetical protein
MLAPSVRRGGAGVLLGSFAGADPAVLAVMRESAELGASEIARWTRVPRDAQKHEQALGLSARKLRKVSRCQARSPADGDAVSTDMAAYGYRK